MRKLLIAIASLLTLGLSYPVFADRDQSLAERMDACFRMHSQLMDKPSVRNIHTCWRAHGYLMERR